MSKRRKKKQQGPPGTGSAGYHAQAVALVIDSLANNYAKQVQALRTHCLARSYPLALLNTITILDLIMGTGHVQSVWKALSILERLNKTLDTRSHPHLADLRELATVADEARNWRRA